ncbi:retroviral-like aspartic protease family protein, partial [Salmonella enterica subsp. enterica serovar 1,4,[5],12:i:-]|nr:retroviral-like aspartic protease family protein [Salmonella enterica subsp. enterica serovar 1,4,[5],12:i:-]
IRDCPQGKQQNNGNQPNKGKLQKIHVKQGRVNFTTLTDLPEGAPVMTGKFLIHNQPAVILFDSGATHSFISPRCAKKCGLKCLSTYAAYRIITAGGNLNSNHMARKVPIKLGSRVILTDLI